MTSVELDIIGAAAPPRLNGELVFNEPWEGRAFGMVMSLCEKGQIDWFVFRDHLIAEIARWEAQQLPESEWNYYARWLRALETTLTENGLLVADNVEQLTTEYLERPHGHDHNH